MEKGDRAVNRGAFLWHFFVILIFEPTLNTIVKRVLSPMETCCESF